MEADLLLGGHGCNYYGQHLLKTNGGPLYMDFVRSIAAIGIQDPLDKDRKSGGRASAYPVVGHVARNRDACASWRGSKFNRR